MLMVVKWPCWLISVTVISQDKAFMVLCTLYFLRSEYVQRRGFPDTVLHLVLLLFMIRRENSGSILAIPTTGLMYHVHVHIFLAEIVVDDNLFGVKSYWLGAFCLVLL